MDGDSPIMAFRKKIWSCVEYVFPYHFPTRDEFLASYLRQLFSLPDSMIYYILKNPASSKVYQKLIQSCKYFFIKNPILIYHCLQIDANGGWKTCSNDCQRKVIHMADIRIQPVVGCKIWIENQLDIYSTDSNYASEFITSIYRCDAEKLYFIRQTLSHHHLLFFSRFVKHIILQKVVINSDAHLEMPIEDIVANLPNIKIIEYDPNSSTNISKDTVKKLLQIPHFKHIDYFLLRNISEKFDIDSLYKYYKNQKSNFFFGVNYQNMPSEEYAKKLDQYVDEMLTFKFPDCLISYIRYPGQDITKQDALAELFKKSLQPFFS